MNRYRLITYLRTDEDEERWLTHEEAIAELQQQQLLFPEHIHRLETIPDHEPCDANPHWSDSR